MNIPDLADWQSAGNYPLATSSETALQAFKAAYDLDTATAFQSFYGKSAAEAMEVFCANPLVHQEDLMWMPAPCFAFYIHAYLDYLVSPEGKVDDDAANCFFSLVEFRPHDFRSCLKKTRAILKKLAKRTVDQSIYGDFSLRAEDCLDLLA